MINYLPTPYGFAWGASEITRLFSDTDKGWVMLGIKTPKQELQVYVTKTGKVRIHDGQGREWLPKSEFGKDWKLLGKAEVEP